MFYELNSSHNCFTPCFQFLDNKTCRHCHGAHPGPAASPHHAHHGLRAAALPAQSQPRQNRPGKMLYYPIVARITETDDNRELLTEPTGACAIFFFFILFL